MNLSVLGKSEPLLALSFIVSFVGAVFTYALLLPQTGFDDANITQAYARHIAAGHGYVYNIGGERVEGSTSLLWTAINVVAFYLHPRPEYSLAFLTFVMTAFTIFISTLITRQLVSATDYITPYILAVAVLVFPGFFGWMVWSLMDITLWVFLITCLVYLLNKWTVDQATDTTYIWLVFISALLPLTRPEGIALTTGLALFYMLRSFTVRDTVYLRLSMIMGVTGAITTIAATLWRLSYFGYIFPNTVYAKKSTDLLGQLILGLKYVLSYLYETQNILLVTVICFSAAFALARGKRTQKIYLFMTLYLIIGGGFTYIILGGDHFGSHRFFLYFIPIGLPIGMVFLSWLREQGRNPAVTILALLPFVLFGIVSLKDFLSYTGNIKHEFTIADEGRVRGEILSELPGTPVIGVIAAGGVRIGYNGPIQDLLALNWTKMAHAEQDERITDIPNHGGFKTHIFWENPPDVFAPRLVTCPNRWSPIEGFWDNALDHVSHTKRFRELYGTACYKGVLFHIRRTYLDYVNSVAPTFPMSVFY